MAIAARLKSVTDFLQKNEALIEAIKDAGQAAAKQIDALSDRLEANREEAAKLVEQIDGLNFQVARDAQTRHRQRLFLDKIEQLSKDIQLFADDPDILVMLYAERGALYVGLGNTFSDSVAQIVTFTPQEIDDLRVLLRRATLDTKSRKQLAHVLDATVQISKLALRVAGRLAA
jgi:hypothetical protein